MRLPRIILSLASFFLAWSAYSQVDESRIGGQVTDNTGAAVPGAQARVTDEATGTVRSTTTSRDGYYAVPQLQRGTYRVEIDAPGFKRAVREHMECSLGQVLTLNFSLQVGEHTELLTVTGQVSTIQTETTSLGNLRHLEQMQDLPENARGVTQLLGFSAGVVKDISDNLAYTPIAGLVTFSSSAPDFTAWVFDGAWGNTPLGGTGNIIPLDGRQFEQNTPNLESIAEYNVTTSNNKAEAPMAATVSVVTKSGGNDVHGSLFEYNRVGAESARSFFAPNREGLTRNQFGGSIGGPIYFPKLYNGRNKSFFFFSYEGFRDFRTTTSSGTLPNTAETNGDLSAELNKIQLRDPLGGIFPNNIIPASRISPVSSAMLKYVPTTIGNQSATTPVPFNYVTNKPVVDRDWKFDIKLDHHIGDKDSLSGRFTDSSGFQNNTNTSPVPALGEGHQFTWGKQLSVTETHIFSPTTLNEIRAGFYRKSRFQTYQLGDVDFLTGSQAIPGITPKAPFQGPPTIILNNSILGVSSGILQTASQTPRTIVEQAFQVSDNLTLVRGRHQYKFGAELRRFDVNWLQASSPSGTFTFGSSSAAANSATGDAYADFLLGLPQTAAWSPAKDNYSRASGYSFFAQDDFKISSSLTINYGLRWDYMGKYYEKYGRDANYDIYIDKVVVPSSGPQFFLPQFNNNPFIVLSNTVGLGRGLIYPDWNDWGPRFGIAYQPFGQGKFVIRGGYGIYYASPSGFLNGQAGLGVPYNISYTYSRASAIGANGTPPSFANPTATGGASGNLLSAVSSVNPWQKDTSAQMWNLTLERQLPRNHAVRASYVGNKGTHEVYAGYQNACVPGPIPCSARGPGQDPAFNPLFPTTAGGMSTWGNSHYAALELELEHRMVNGLFYNVNYTFGKTLAHDNNVEDPLQNRQLDYGPFNYSITHMFHFNGLWDIPLGKGKAAFGNAGAVLNALVSNWKLSGDLYVRSGLRYTVTAPASQSGAGASVERANCVGNPNLPSGRSENDQFNQYFNTAAFVTPALGTIGTCGVGILQGPGLWTADTSLNRLFPVTEHLKLQFRADFFNVFNHANFANPDSVITDSAFGKITSTTGFPRQMQFGLHLRW
jgi:hypothetical protein